MTAPFTMYHTDFFISKSKITKYLMLHTGQDLGNKQQTLAKERPILVVIKGRNSLPLAHKSQVLTRIRADSASLLRVASIFRRETKGVEDSRRNPAATRQSPPPKDLRPPMNIGKMKNGKSKWWATSKNRDRMKQPKVYKKRRFLWHIYQYFRFSIILLLMSSYPRRRYWR